MSRGEEDPDAALRLADPWWAINRAKLPEYIRIVESFGYVVTRTEDKPLEGKGPVLVVVPADGVLSAEGTVSEDSKPVRAKE